MSSSSSTPLPKVTLATLEKMRANGEKITMLTCYDASFAAVLDAAGVDTLLIGDSLGMVLQGHDSTLPVTLTDVAYHTACVARGSQRALVIADIGGKRAIESQDDIRHIKAAYNRVMNQALGFYKIEEK